MRDEIRYMDVVNEVNENRCLYIRPVLKKQEQQQKRTKKSSKSPWRRVCDDDDSNCIGVDSCNLFECKTTKTNKKGVINKKTIRYRQTIWDNARNKIDREKNEITPIPMELQE